MQVNFLKDHPSGIKQGASANLEDNHAKRLVKEGYCEADGVDPEALKLEDDKNKVEPETIEYTITEKDDTKKGPFKGRKVGDKVQVPNPKFKK